MDLYDYLYINISSENKNETYFDDDSVDCFNGYQNPFVYVNHISSVILIICFIGLLENGIVIWLLGFQIKRNPFTVLILNLAIADFGFLLYMAIFCFYCFTYFISPGILWVIFFAIFFTMHINGLFLLAAISIDRCVTVLSPECHRCSWPKYLSSAGCAYLWMFSFLLGWSLYIGQYSFRYEVIWAFYLVVISALCLPLTTISNVILFIKICLKPKQMKRRRLLVMILITLLCFHILTLPLYIYMFIVYILGMNDILKNPQFVFYFYLNASLNSSVKPMIYFLVGRMKRIQSRENFMVIFQRVFGEDEISETG